MPSAAAGLEHLQALDLEIDANRAVLDRVAREIKGDPALDRSRREVEAHQRELTRLQAELRRLEARSDDLTGSLERLNQRLYSGMIHDARELRSLEAEIEHTRTQIARLEDSELEMLELIENLEPRLAAAKSELQRLSDGRESTVIKLREEQKEREAQTAKLSAQRQDLEAQVPPRLLAQYERLRSRLGHAVSHVTEGICEWCRVQLPSQDVQHARGDTIVTCTNCGRILFAE